MQFPARALPSLPEGFELADDLRGPPRTDRAAAPVAPLPPGFELLDETPALAAAAPALPPGFEFVDEVQAPSADPAALPAGFELAPDAADRSWSQRNLTDPLGRGWNQLQVGANVLGGEIGVLSPQEVAQGIVENSADAALYPIQPDVAAGMQEITSAPTGWEAVKAAARNPGAVANTFVESIPASGASILGGAAGAIGGGLAAGPIGATAGLVGGTGLVSGATEYASSIREVLTERGIPDTPDAIAAALQDPDLMAAARQKAALRGAAVGGFDALTAGVAGKIAGPTAKLVERAGAGRVGQGLAGVAGETGAQMAGGAAGEASGQILSEGQITSPGAVVLEAAAEIPGAAIDVPGAVLGRKAGEAVAARGEPTPPPGFEVVEQVQPAAPPDGFEGVDQTAPVPAATAPEPVAPTPAAPEPEPSVAAAPPEPQVPAPAGGPSAVEPQTPEPSSPEPSPVPPPEPPAPVPAAPASASPVPAAPASASPVRTPDGSVSVDTVWQVADLKDLRAAGGDLQPRQRDVRLASDAQINEIASRLDPSRLVESQESDRGAPIIDDFGTILSGNGRVAAIELAKSKNPAGFAAYVKAIQDRGYDVNGIETPVLVRVAKGLDDARKRDFVVKSNKAATLAMASGEQAAVDAGLIEPDVLQHLDTETDAGLQSASNAQFVRAVLAKLPAAAEQAAFMGPDGRLSADGARRLEAAVFAKAYGDRDLTNKIVEEGNGGGVAKALMAAAPAWTQMRANADPKFDVTDKLVGAVAAVSDMRRRGLKPDAYFGQTDAFTKPDPATEMLARAFYNPTAGRAAAWADVRDFLRSYADAALNQRNADGDLFGEAPKTAEGLLAGLLAPRTRRAVEDPAHASVTAQIARLEASGKSPGQLAKLRAALARMDGANPQSTAAAAEERLRDDGPSTRIPRGGLAPAFMDRSVAKGSSMFEQAFRDAGLDPDRARTMPAGRQIEVLRDLVRSKFGFAGIADNAIKALDGIDQLLDAYRNLQFMSHALAIPNKAIGLGNRLRLDLEPWRGRYLGAYSPDTKTIHMPGRSNSFAHEWAHALDHYLLGRILQDGTTASYLLSHEARTRGLDPTGSVEAAFAGLMNVLFHDKAEVAARLAQLETIASDTDPVSGAPTPKALAAEAEIRRIRGGATGPTDAAPSDYARSVQQFDPASNYWSKPTEMLARAFEAYVAHKVELAGGGNAFITKGDTAYLDNADRRLRETFPKDDTRATIFAAFDDVMMHVQNAAIFGTDPIAERPADTDVVDPMHWFRASLGAPMTSVPEAVRREVNRLRNAIMNPREAMRSGVSEMAMNAGLDRDPAVAERYPIWRRVKDTATFPVWSMRGVMKTIVARTGDDAKPYLQALVDFFATDPGTGRAIGETYEEAVTRAARRDANEIAAALRSLGFDAHLSKDDADHLRGLLLAEDRPAAPADVVKLAAAMRRLYDRLWRANTDAGIEHGYVRDTGYLNRVLNDQAVFDDSERFEAQATQVYGHVFDRETRDETGAVRPDELRDRIAQVKRFQPQRLETPAFKSVVEGVRALNRELRKLQKAQTPNTAAIDALQKRLDARYDDLAALVRPEWSSVAAIRWKEAILQGDEFDFATRGPDGTFARSRTLPPEADRLLEDFYVRDPIAAFQIYSLNSARKREYVSRFGLPVGGETDLNHLLNANGGKNGLREAITANRGRYDLGKPVGRARVITELTDVRTVNRQEMLLKEAMRAGVNPEDIRTFRDLAERITGRRASDAPSWLRRLSTFFYAAGSLAMMPRAVWNSISEPLTAYFHTRDAKIALAGFIAYVSEARQSAQSVRDRRALAEAIGLTTSPYFEGIVSHQMNQGYSDSVNATHLLARMYERSGLTPLTNAQRRAMMVPGWLHFQKLARAIADAGVPDARREIARAEFRDLGVSDEAMGDFVDWVSQSHEMPTLADLGTRAGEIFQVAITRFVDQTIQEAKRVDKPALALDPIGRLAFGLSSFNYRFMRSVHFAQILRGVRDTRIFRDAGAGPVSATVQGAFPAIRVLAAGFALLTVGQFLTAIVREALLNGDKWDEMKRKGQLQQWLWELAVSRAGILGALDPLNQARIGLRYDRDLTALYAGPHIAYFLGAAQGMLALAAPARGDGKPKFDAMGNQKRAPNTSEWNAAKSAYQVFAAPAASWLLSSVPAAGPLTGAALGLGMQKLSSNSASDTFANTVVGEKDSRRALRERERRRALGGL